MTTKTQYLKNKLKDLDPKDIEKTSAALGFIIETGFSVVVANKARRAAKRGEYDRATYYAVATLISHLSIHHRAADMRRKGFIK